MNTISPQLYADFIGGRIPRENPDFIKCEKYFKYQSKSDTT
jgi:hypothetical protein